jgi:hypothetical protein
VRFAIRDDDTCFFTKPEDLERAYRWLPPEVPVSLAITPFAVESFHLGDPARFYQKGEPQPLGGNRELVAFLREGSASGRWSFMCHGITHEYRRTNGQLLGECIWKPKDRLRRELQTGRAYLESELGGRIDTFVPPGNAISRGAIEALGGMFSGVLGALPLRRWREFISDRHLWPALAARAWHQLLWNGPGVFPQKICNLRILASTAITPAADLRDVLRVFERSKRAGADFCVAVHYWELETPAGDKLRRLADVAARSGCEFTTCQALLAASRANPVTVAQEAF